MRKPRNGSTQEPDTAIDLVRGGAWKVVRWVLREFHFSVRVLGGGSQKGDTDAELKLGSSLMNPGKKGQFRLTMGGAASIAQP